MKAVLRGAHGWFAKGTAAISPSSQKGFVHADRAPIGIEYLKQGKWVRKVNNSPKRSERFEYVHIINWVTAHGRVPEGMKLMCLGDKADTSIDNYMLVPAGAVPRIHGRFPGGLAAAPADLRRAIVAAGVLEFQLAERAQANPDSLPRTRLEAEQTSSMYYFTGKPCPSGHRVARLTRSQACLACVAEYRKERRSAARRQLSNSHRTKDQS